MKKFLNFLGIKSKDPQATEVKIVEVAPFTEVVREAKQEVRAPATPRFTEIEAKRIETECRTHKL